MKWAGEDCTGIYGLRWIREGETVSFCSNAPASPYSAYRSHLLILISFLWDLILRDLRSHNRDPTSHPS